MYTCINVWSWPMKHHFGGPLSSSCSGQSETHIWCRWQQAKFPGCTARHGRWMVCAAALASWRKATKAVGAVTGTQGDSPFLPAGSYCGLVPLENRKFIRQPVSLVIFQDIFKIFRCQDMLSLHSHTHTHEHAHTSTHACTCIHTHTCSFTHIHKLKKMTENLLMLNKC